MAQGEFTKEEAAEATRIASAWYKMLPKSKQYAFFADFNRICLFLESAKAFAPAGKQQG